MSTRATIFVQHKGDTFEIYRHSDGYPEGEHGVLATLPQALPFAWPLPRFEASDFAAAIVAAWKKGGGDIRLCGSPQAPWLRVEMPGGHDELVADTSCDSQWLYIVTGERITLKVETFENNGTGTDAGNSWVRRPEFCKRYGRATPS